MLSPLGKVITDGYLGSSDLTFFSYVLELDQPKREYEVSYQPKYQAMYQSECRTGRD